MSEGKTVHQAISAVMAEMAGIGKDQVNRDQGYKFRGIDDVLKELHPLLAKHGVILAPDVVEREYEERVAKSGTVGHCAHLHVRYTVYGPNGDSIELSTWGQGLDYGDKETNKAMTMAFKYALFQLFAVADPTDDADHDSPGESTTPTTARSTVRRTAGGEAPPCTQPGCSGHLVERKNRESGEAFVSCTNYKECHFRAVNGTMDQYLGMADAPPDDGPGQHPSDGATRVAQIAALVNGMAQNDIRDAFKAAGASDCLAAVGSGWKIRGAEVAWLSADVWAALVQALSGDVDPDEIPFP